jgi:hypothetical protein
VAKYSSPQESDRLTSDSSTPASFASTACATVRLRSAASLARRLETQSTTFLRVAVLSTLAFAACFGQVSSVGLDASIPSVRDAGEVGFGGGTSFLDAGTNLGGGGVASGGSGEAGGTPAGGSGGISSGAGGGVGSGGGSALDAGSTGGGNVTPTCGVPSADRATEVCRRWACDRKNLDEGVWTGTADPTCDAGDVPLGRASALRLLNLYRFVADLPPVVTTPSLDAMSQACALMMYANRTISHTPPSSWKCYTALGAQGAGSSNICGGSAVQCMDIYMSDYGNETTLGHRRWFISNNLGQVGIGGTPGGSCVNVFAGGGTGNKPWISWPAPGIVPLESIHFPGLPSVDSTGWLFQSYSMALSGATVSVKDNGVAAPVTQLELGGGYGGSNLSLSFKPMGWSTQANHVYTVVITLANGTQAAQYEVKPVSCPSIP